MSVIEELSTKNYAEKEKIWYTKMIKSGKLKTKVLKWLIMWILMYYSIHKQSDNCVFRTNYYHN